MAIEVFEPLRSRRITSGRNPSGEIAFRVEGTEDESAARLALLAEAPRSLTVPGEDGAMVTLTRTGVTVDADGADSWNGSVQYTLVPDANQARVSFTTGGGTLRIRQSLATTPYPVQVSAHGGAINMNKDGVVEGVDVRAGPMSFSIHQAIPVIDLTANLVRLLLAMRNTTNRYPWRGYAAGEVLFVEATGSERGDGMADMEYKFEASPNVYQQPLRSDRDEAGMIRDPILYDKKGWEYAEPIYEDVHIESSHRVIASLVGVLIHQVYAETDFSLLPIAL